MRKTYITRMPDKAGAFLLASRIIAAAGGNIVRVNYNRAMDTHTLFIEVRADEEQHRRIAGELSNIGYLTGGEGPRILLVVAKLRDVPGAVTPVLEILGRRKVNISYISAQENGTPYQHFKMGLLIEDTVEMTRLIDEISRVCEISILDYEVTDRLLDGTVFYITFANEMREILHLDQETTNQVLVQANRLMQILDEQKKPPLQTFDYIRRFAKFVEERKGANFNARVDALELAGGRRLYSIEPPCGSTTYVLDSGGPLIFIDCGFACYRREMLSLLGRLFPDFDRREKLALITHGDIDHTGLLDIFDRVYMSGECLENFRLQREGKPDFRELNPLHQPYCALSKVISGYQPPDLGRCLALGSRSGRDILEPIGDVELDGLTFRLYEGSGGHVRGDTVIACPELKLIFSGDIYVNIKEMTQEQREFNALAPFLMTGVDSDPAAAKACREYLLRKFSGYALCPGHGPILLP